jgi:hypothetical protein
MSEARHDALLDNVNTLIDGLRPQEHDYDIARILAGIQPTYEHVIHGGNPAEIAALSLILEEMNDILRHKSAAKKIKNFNEMYDRELAANPHGSMRLTIIGMILFHGVWLDEQARLETARNIAARQLAKAAADADYHRSPAQVAARAESRRLQAERDTEAAATQALADAAAAKAVERQLLIQMMGQGQTSYPGEMADQLTAMRAHAVASQGKPAKPSKALPPIFGIKKNEKKKGGNKSHKKGGKKSHKKRSHRRRH